MPGQKEGKCGTIPERFISEDRGGVPDSRSGLITGDFTILFASLITALAHKDFAKVIGISCRDALPVWVGFWACFFETCALSACLAFLDPRGFPYESAWKIMF